jgi:hypothetical protein
MEPRIRELVRRRAGDRCEYCLLPQAAAPFVTFHLEHVIARQHGGSDEAENLAWACHRCNAYKGTNVAGVDPQSRAIVPLFHPRTDDWSVHFLIRGAEIVGLTPCGRATLQLLRFNDGYRVELREAWLREERAN